MPAAAITQANWLIRRATDDVISMAGSLSGCRLAVELIGLVSTLGSRPPSGRPAVARNRVALRRSRPVLRKEDVRPPAQQYRRDVSRRNWAFDIALAAVVGVLGQLEVWWGIGSTHRQGPLWVQSLLYAVTALLLVGRRVRPLACLTAMVVVSVVEFVAVGSPEGFGVSVAPLIATYTVGNRLEWRRSWVGLALSCRGLGGMGGVRPDEHDLRRGLVVVGLADPVDHRVAAGRARTGHAGSTPSSDASTASSGRHRPWPRNGTGSPASCTT